MKDRITIYDNEKYLTPLCKGNIVYCETALVLKNALNFISEIRLAYPIKKILSVTSFDLKTVYEEGKDYYVNENGELQIIEGGKIPYLPWENYRYNEFVDDGKHMQSADALGAYIVAELFGHDDGMSQWMIAVTYEHEESDIYDVTQDKSSKVEGFLAKLKKGEKVTVVSYGDSITYGWGASGMHEVKKPPFTPPYNLMVIEYLQKHFNCSIKHENFAVSGMCTDWGEKDENIQKVIDAKPDFVILAFGMNDAGGFHPNVFYQKMANIITKIRKGCGNVEFVILSPIMPNPLTAFTAGSSICRYHGEYPRVFERLEKNLTGVAWANVTKIHNILLERKALADTLSNNVNHPNDFMHRIYAQTVLKTILGDEFDL